MTAGRLAAAVAVVLALLCVHRFVRAWRWSDVDFHPGRTALPPMPQGPLWAGARAVEFGPGLRGWYLPSRNGAAVVLCHGTETDRRSMIPHAEILGRHGFGALLYDFPGQGESAGEIRWGAPELQSVRAAVDFLLAQPGVHAVGALGESMGGYVLARVARDEPRLRAFALFSTFTDLREMTQRQLGALGSVWILAGMAAVRHDGLEPKDARPVEAVKDIAPRPLLVASGALDSSIPPAMTRQLFAAAGEPKELWIVPGANHSGEIEAAPAEADRRLAALFATLLRP